MLSRAVELVEAEIGEEAFGEAWVSVLVFPSRLHSCYVETVYDNIQVNDGMLLGKAQVIVLNKALANKAKDLGHIHETLMMGKIVKTFLRVSMVIWCECYTATLIPAIQTYMYRALSAQPSPYWMLTLLMWARLPLFPDGAHRFVEWPHEEDIFILEDGDNVIYQKRKSEIKSVKKEDGKDPVYTILTVMGDDIMREKTLKVDRDEISVLYDHRSTDRIIEVNKRAEMFAKKKNVLPLNVTDVKTL